MLTGVKPVRPACQHSNDVDRHCYINAVLQRQMALASVCVRDCHHDAKALLQVQKALAQEVSKIYRADSSLGVLRLGLITHHAWLRSRWRSP